MKLALNARDAKQNLMTYSVRRPSLWIVSPTSWPSLMMNLTARVSIFVRFLNYLKVVQELHRTPVGQISAGANTAIQLS